MSAGDWLIVAGVVGGVGFALFVGWAIVRAGDEDDK